MSKSSADESDQLHMDTCTAFPRSEHRKHLIDRLIDLSPCRLQPKLGPQHATLPNGWKIPHQASPSSMLLRGSQFYIQSPRLQSNLSISRPIAVSLLSGHRSEVDRFAVSVLGRIVLSSNPLGSCDAYHTRTNTLATACVTGANPDRVDSDTLLAPDSEDEGHEQHDEHSEWYSAGSLHGVALPQRPRGC